MIIAAAKAGHTDIVEILLSFGQQHNIPVPEMITMDTMGAAVASLKKPLEVLLKYRAVDPKVFSRHLHLGTDLLSVACTGGKGGTQYLGLLRYLMDAGFDPNKNRPPFARRRSPGHLEWACWQACPEIVESMLAHGATIKGSYAMRTATFHGRIDVLELLVKYGGDVNEVAEEGEIGEPQGAPLHVAAVADVPAAGREAVVRWLLAHGADVTVKDSKGTTAKEALEEKRIVLASNDN
jgi:ankyrin repeat protein